MTSLNIRPVPSSSTSSSSKPIPPPSLLKPWDFSYSPSSDGCDKNLLIMFHGLGDSKIPFFNLGKQLSLPSTAILSLSAPDPIPLMDHPSFSWYPTFTPTFDPLPIQNHNPTVHMAKLRNLTSILISKEVGWELKDIHLFGFGQGGTIALELGLSIYNQPLGTGQDPPKRFGSIVSICASILTHPTSTLNIQTPVCYFTRHSPQSAIHQKNLNVLKRAYKDVEVVQASGDNEQMPRNKDEWYGIMKFWGQVLGRKDEGWKGQGEVYEVVR
ncbi:hypothetical protein I204_03121 [Kwoniella mangroviensis CBS 8886]|uniref:uncharacterized protein n=1 Tax=Kwoniella mangroviensis CBS 8507 TaxID=1296122 RepID=UPI00080CD6F1|nr:uncharacterized protein I203_00178 [Kwoniella mangroviensis CBS 8507]OCF70048.1 hypothetical protein I203_00178 [Kwoniella mangroviensis CBS 8507]OCF75826.1 hypothetical protein I204_03121 [Kwoniella mangroviensis CBS 8886]